MTSRAAIAALALMKIGAPDPYSTPDGNHASRAVDAAWDSVLAAVVRGHGKHQPKWNFALKYGEATARAAPPENPVPFGWSYAFAMPTGFVRLVEIVAPSLSGEGWRFAGGEVLTRTAGPLKFWYLLTVADPAKWDASFVQAFAARLAFEIADVIAADPQRRAACWQEFEAALSAAAKVDAVENPPIRSDEDDWVLARGPGWGWGDGWCGGRA